MSFNPAMMRPVNPVWPIERIERLTSLWAEAADDGTAMHSAAAIGLLMGCGKNAIVGKVHRLGLPGRPSVIRAGTGTPYRRKLTAEIVSNHIVIVPCVPTLPLLASALAAKRTPPEPVKPKVPERPVDAPLPRYGAGSTCQWPVSEGLPHRFCGDPCISGKPYCDKHARLAYVRVRDLRDERDVAAMETA